ncbi:2-phospho-L-lactate transferase [Streptomyces lydicus]|uniref:Phosphoenolpyruvate transferase n=1 Tax=Streptomyces lydicus TaxID=47763 RepID=A0A1D7VFL1_9ACTN|nr:2-phospho-L-lactate transferase [Streptomyces lydicus]AOP45546.1 2-phospho-L-lactate transferase [Streptomyces lydicus]
MRIVVLAGGIGGARFLRGLKAAAPDADITVIGNTGDDIHLFGLKVCPDLDTVMYTLGGGINEDQGWGRADETFRVKEELAAYGVGPEWFGLGDRDFATHIVRTQMLGAGYPLSAVTQALCDRWQPGVRLLPMTDDRIETHVAIEEDGEQRAVHFQEYWVRLRASVDAKAVVPVGAEQAAPAPGVLEAVAQADVILFPPSNPVVSVGTILAVPGIREAIAEAGAPVVGLSPLVGDAPVRGMADKVLAAVGVASTASAVAGHYGARRRPARDGAGAGLLDGWLVDTVDAGRVPEVEAAGIRCRAVPLMMTDLDATAAMAREALALAEEVRA